MHRSNEEIIERIRTNCLVDSNGCWNWAGKLNNRSRPVCRINNKTTLAYRHTYEAYYNKKVTQLVCHSCDNPKCCNPEHLFEGSNQDNQLDYKNKFKNKHTHRPTSICPSSLVGLERLYWYRDNACLISGDCWLWSREVGEDGYGRVKYKNRKHMSHRLMWALSNDTEPDNIPSDKVIRHVCYSKVSPNKSCCNPKHLVIGTRSENQLDTLKYAKSVKYEEEYLEWLWIYYWYLDDGNDKTPLKVAKGLRQLGLVSDEVTDQYVVDVLRGKNKRNLHKQVFDWTPSWK